MRKFTFLFISLYSGFSMFGQTFSDNFDSYIAGQKLAAQSGGAWTTWSNQPGGAEDGLVSNANSYSAPNSVYFSSTVDGGGPVDQVKHFGVLNTGQFSLEMMLFVESGKSAYFNLQKTATMGATWALNANFNDNGTFTLDDATNINLSGNYTQNVWFNLRLDINFNSNHWEVFIDDVSVGSFSNSVNQVASIDIFPVDQNTPFASGFYVDDFSYTITPYTLPNLNAAVTNTIINGANLSGSQVENVVKIRNLGQTTITSFDISSVYNGNTINQSVTGLNLASLAETQITLNNTFTLVPGSNNLVTTVSNVNGNATDGDANDNSLTKNLNPIVPAIGKMVFGEEATGTWCGWCPRGAVAMDFMENKYSNFWAGVAVHNGDPMVVTAYDAAMGALVSGYPSSLVDRGNPDDPTAMEPKFLDRITIAPKALLTSTASLDTLTNILTVNVSSYFQSAASSSYKLACILSEDSVSGTASGYSQANNYSGSSDLFALDGSNWKNKPNPVPAAQMVYDHVARDIQPGFNGLNNSFPAIVNQGETHTNTFTFNIDSTWNIKNMHIISILIDPSGRVDNAGKATYSQAASLKDAKLNKKLYLFPNPAKTELNVFSDIKKVNEISIYGLDGKKYNIDFINNEGFQVLNISNLNSGIYIIELKSSEGKFQRKFVKE